MEQTRCLRQAVGDMDVAWSRARLDEKYLIHGFRKFTLGDRYLPEGLLPLREFCLYSKRQFLRKKYKNIRFCYVKSLYFRYTSKIKKFRTKNPDFGTFLYGIRCFGAFYTKLSIYRNFPAQYSSYYNVITITLHDFGRVSL